MPATNGTTPREPNGSVAPGKNGAPAGAAEESKAGTNGTPPAKESKESPAPRERSDQDQQIASDIGMVGQVIAQVFKDATVRAPLSRRGFDTQKLQGGLDLCDTAQKCWNNRQTAMADQLSCTKHVNTLFDAAVKSLSDFRETARATFVDEAPLKALGVTEAVPSDFSKFLTHARSAYAAAQKPEYGPLMTEHGYGTPELKAEVDALKALEEANSEQSRASADAKKATRLRDEAVEPVRTFRSKLMKIARRVFRNDPEQAAKLKF